VQDFTGAPEMLGGRVKTLHPKVHGGILGRRDLRSDQADMQQQGIEPIDLVVVNLYPFREAVAKELPYDEVIELSDDLRRRAQHHGALRGVAFATALIGEAALLKGDLDTATRELEDAVALHRDVDAPAGEAHSLQRLAEVRLARGDRAGAVELLRRALPLARWTVNSLHLLQRIYGTMALAAGDPVEAVSVIEQGEAAMGETDRCTFCDVMFAVPAAISHADVGDVATAERYLAVAEEAVARWEGTAWDAAVAEVRAHLAQARGDAGNAGDWSRRAADLFAAAGQPRDAERCSRWVPRKAVAAVGLRAV